MNIQALFADPLAEVLYVGASVTVQKEGYRPAFHDLLEKFVGRKIIAHVNALGGVGSIFGLANFNRFKINYSMVRLAFLEYSTGDLNLWITPKEQIAAIVDEFVTTISDYIDHIVILHCYRSDHTSEERSYIRGIYNAAGSRLHCSTVNLYADVELAIDQGVYKVADLYRDHCHTTVDGGNFVAAKLFDYMQSIDFGDRSNLVVVPEEKIEPLEYYPMDQVEGHKKLGTFEYGATSLSFSFHEMSTNEPLELQVSGVFYGVVFIVGPLSACVDVDFAGSRQTVNSFDHMCFYERPHCLPFYRQLAHPSELIRLSISGKPIDFSIVRNPSPLFDKPRVVKLCGFIGRGLAIRQLNSSGVGVIAESGESGSNAGTT